MATHTRSDDTDQTVDNLLNRDTRAWNEFAYLAFARIVARKHDVVVPAIELANLSDEELVRRLRLVSELAHLPPA